MNQRKLIIAEKPSVANELAKVISPSRFENKKTYLENHEFIITWCVGHLLQLEMPDAYGIKSWSLSTLPFIPEEFKIKPVKEVEQQLGTMKALMHRYDVSEIINACDAGREGELIFRLIYDYVKCTKSYKRLWITSYENDVIQDDMTHLLDGFEMERLYQAGVCRQRADYLVGINGTRLMSSKYGTELNVGRVQSPTLNFICTRDYQIKDFVSQTNYNVQLMFKDFAASYVHKDDEVMTRALAEKIKNHCKGKDGFIETITTKENKHKPEKLFSLTQLQKKANRLWGYTAHQTLQIAQRLYEKKLLTYPRTDSSYLSSSQADIFKSLIEGLVVGNKLVLQESFKKGKADFHMVINNQKVTDHHAILITAASLYSDWTRLSYDEQNIIHLVAYQMLIAISPPMLTEGTKVILNVDGYEFEAGGNVLVDIGYRQLERVSLGVLGYTSPSRNSATLPELTGGEVVEVLKSEVLETETKPKQRITEAELLGAMEKGLGTSATRAEIIENLIRKEYVIRDGKKLIATEKAHQLMLVLPAELKTPDLTVAWEEKLNAIEQGLVEPGTFMGSIESFVNEFVAREKERPRLTEFKLPNKDKRELIGYCPKCQDKVVEGKANFYCCNRECRFALWKDDNYFGRFGTTITKARAKSLLIKGHVRVSKLKSKKGNYFSATVLMDASGKYTSFELQYDS